MYFIAAYRRHEKIFLQKKKKIIDFLLGMCYNILCYIEF